LRFQIIQSSCLQQDHNEREHREAAIETAIDPTDTAFELYGGDRAAATSCDDARIARRGDSDIATRRDSSIRH